MRCPREKHLGLVVKRLFDIFVSLLGLLMLSPLLFTIAILIRVKMSRPVFFTQQRVGRYGKLFNICKFRTMSKIHNGSSVSIYGEARITPLGAILRKYKLDELPELWNILTGEMSFVGPRPDVPQYSNQLIGEEKEILNLRPGLTSPASLKFADEERLLSLIPDPKTYNDEVIWPEKVKMNLEYVRSRSFFGDIYIMLETIFFWL